MPDLSSEGVHKFWHEHKDPYIYKIISFMENVESWPLEGDPALERSVAEFGTILDDIGQVDLQAEDKFIQLATCLKTGRALRLLQSMDAAHPGAAAKILMFAKNNSKSSDDVFGLFLRRNVVFERLRLLSRIFAADRLAIVTKILGEVDHV